jgi:hypothetical protein
MDGQHIRWQTESARSSCEPSLQATTQQEVSENLSNMSHHDNHSTGPQESARSLHHSTSVPRKQKRIEDRHGNHMIKESRSGQARAREHKIQ